MAAFLSLVLLVGVALAMAYPQLPDISDLADYRPKLSMRVFSAEGKVIGEFGEERRKLVPFKDIPDVVKQAVLSIEDARFYQHGGVDYIGLARASALDLGPYGITVNCLCPGPFLTDMPGKLLNDEEKQYFADRTALKRWAAPRELAGPALLLASEAGAYITGQGIVVDGGAAVNVL
jgi:hypothetical protein